MANTERPVEACNWDRRRFISLGPDFRIDANNPQMGDDGKLIMVNIWCKWWWW